jgi:predicted secreted Zn-dependent protease
MGWWGLPDIVRIDGMKKVIVLLMMVLVPVFLWADRIVLKGGKTLHGKIIDENDHEVMIRSGSGMFFRIERSKIRKIERAGGNQPKGPVVTMDDLDQPNKKKAEPKKTAEPKKAKAAKKPEPPRVSNIKPVTKYRKSQNGNASIFETVVFKTYAVGGSNVKKVFQDVYDRDDGKGFMVKRDRQASKTELDVSWEGTSIKEGNAMRWETLVIRATMTVTVPHWNAPKKPSEDSVQKWGQFVDQLEKHNGHHVEIYARGLESVGSALGQVSAKDESQLQMKSEKIYKRIMGRTEKQQDGHDRRRPIDWQKILEAL